MNRDIGRILRDGMVAGLLGYVTVAAVVAVLDLLNGRSPFYTVAVLGSVLFFGLRDLDQLVIWPGPVLAFNGAHLLAFLCFGLFMAWLASLAERGPQLWYVSVIVFLIVVPHLVGLPIWLDSSIRQVVSIWNVVGATSAAAIVMASYLWFSHPALRNAPAGP